jgi:hypothetical protein
LPRVIPQIQFYGFCRFIKPNLKSANSADSVSRFHRFCRLLVTDPVGKSVAFCSNGTCQRPVVLSRGPCRIILLFLVMNICSPSNIARQPSSHSRPIDRSEWLARFGNRWAWRAAFERPGMFSSPVCVDRMICPFGRCTCRPCWTGWMLRQGLVMRRKLPVHPVSAIACIADLL